MDRRRNRRTAPALESLEGRRVLSVAQPVLENGVLTVAADAANDNVLITERDGRIRVDDLRSRGDDFTFPAADVTSLVIDLGAGNDRLLVALRSAIPMTVTGGAGNDWLTGGPGADSILGGDGNDVLYGAGGADLLDGEAGNDGLYGDAGDDTLLGRAGNDLLLGGAGDDDLDGGAGNDWLAGLGGRDTIAGVARGDVVIRDRLDVIVNADGTPGGNGPVVIGPKARRRA